MMYLMFQLCLISACWHLYSDPWLWWVSLLEMLWSVPGTNYRIFIFAERRECNHIDSAIQHSVAIGCLSFCQMLVLWLNASGYYLLEILWSVAVITEFLSLPREHTEYCFHSMSVCNGPVNHTSEQHYWEIQTLFGKRVSRDSPDMTP